MKKLIFLSLLSNLVFACGFRTEVSRVPVPLSYTVTSDTKYIQLGYARFIPKSDNEDKIVAVVLNRGDHFSENYAIDIAKMICATCGIECLLPDRQGCGMSDNLQQSLFDHEIERDFHEMLFHLYPANQKFVLVGHSTGARYATDMVFSNLKGYKTNIIGLNSTKSRAMSR